MKTFGRNIKGVLSSSKESLVAEAPRIYRRGKKCLKKHVKLKKYKKRDKVGIRKQLGYHD